MITYTRFLLQATEKFGLVRRVVRFHFIREHGAFYPRILLVTVLRRNIDGFLQSQRDTMEVYGLD